jgi:hypothetical protein
MQGIPRHQGVEDVVQPLATGAAVFAVSIVIISINLWKNYAMEDPD